MASAHSPLVPWVELVRSHRGFSMDHPAGAFKNGLSDFFFFLASVPSESLSIFRLAGSAFACLLTLRSYLPGRSCRRDRLSGIEGVARWKILGKISPFVGGFSDGDGRGIGLGWCMEEHIPVPVLDWQPFRFVLRNTSYLGRSADPSKGLLMTFANHGDISSVWSVCGLKV